MHFQVGILEIDGPPQTLQLERVVTKCAVQALLQRRSEHGGTSWWCQLRQLITYLAQTLRQLGTRWAQLAAACNASGSLCVLTSGRISSLGAVCAAAQNRSAGWEGGKQRLVAREPCPAARAVREAAGRAADKQVCRTCVRTTRHAIFESTSNATDKAGQRSSCEVDASFASVETLQARQAE